VIALEVHLERTRELIATLALAIRIHRSHHPPGESVAPERRHRAGSGNGTSQSFRLHIARRGRPELIQTRRWREIGAEALPASTPRPILCGEAKVPVSDDLGHQLGYLGRLNNS
jgi:hypothetical protein